MGITIGQPWLFAHGECVMQVYRNEKGVSIILYDSAGSKRAWIQEREARRLHTCLEMILNQIAETEDGK